MQTTRTNRIGQSAHPPNIPQTNLARLLPFGVVQNFPTFPALESTVCPREGPKPRAQAATQRHPVPKARDLLRPGPGFEREVVGLLSRTSSQRRCHQIQGCAASRVTR